MPQFWSGNGSNIQIGATILNCKATRVRKGARLAENTHSGVSSTNFEPVVNDNSWTASIPWDSTNVPDTGFSLAPGAKVIVQFNLGRSGKFETLTQTTVETVEDIMDNENDIIRTEVTGKGGALTPA